MKKNIILILAIIMIASASAYLFQGLFLSKDNSASNLNKISQSNSSTLTKDDNSHLSEVALLQSNTSKNLSTTPTGFVAVPVQEQPADSFEQFLASMPTHDQEKYIKLNEYFFGALAFSSVKEYAMLTEQGFPSLKEINYVMEYSRKDLNQALRNNISAYPQYTDNPELNLSSISSVNLVTTIEELENEIKYYLPEYKQYTPLPSKDEYTNNEYPIQVQTAMSNLINSYSVVMSYTAIEFLAEARYAQLVKNNTKSVLTKLAMANKKLQGNDNILNYVKEHYPEDLDTYIELTNTL